MNRRKEFNTRYPYVIIVYPIILSQITQMYNLYVILCNFGNMIILYCNRSVLFQECSYSSDRSVASDEEHVTEVVRVIFCYLVVIYIQALNP